MVYATHTSTMTSASGHRIRSGEDTPSTKRFALAFCLFAFLIALLLGRAMEYLPKEVRQELEVIIGALELAAAVVGLVAIWYALEHKFHIDAVRGNIEDALHTLHTVANAATTRFRGRFPQHIRDLSQLIDSAERGDKVSVVVDCVDYGSFFGPRLHQELHNALRRAVKTQAEVSIALVGPLRSLTYNSVLADRNLTDLVFEQSFAEQFPLFLEALRHDKTFREWLRLESERSLPTWLRLNSMDSAKIDECVKKLPTCMAVCEGMEREPLLSDDVFYETLLHSREAFFEGQLSGVTIKRFRHTHRPSTFFWIVRGAAIFTLGDTGMEARGLAFGTHDQKLVEIFESGFDRIWNSEPSPL